MGTTRNDLLDFRPRGRRRSRLTPLGQSIVMIIAMLAIGAAAAITVGQCSRSVTLGAAYADDFYPLARAILEYGRKTPGKPDWERSKLLAGLATKHCTGAGGKYPLDPWTLAALMRTESGFRPGAVSKNADGMENRGILQLHEAYVPAGVDPFDPASAIPEGCKKLRRWRELCPGIDLGDAWALVRDGHDWMSHWFGGNHPPPRAHASAALVRYRVLELRAVR